VSSRGTQRENLVKDWLEERGWIVGRAAASLGAADLMAMRDELMLPMIDSFFIPNGKLLVQVKSTKAGSFAGFGPADRAELLLAGEKAGADVVLCWTPPCQGKKIELHWIWPEDWPEAKRARRAA
jgi:Holliday junction resolvase